MSKKKKRSSNARLGEGSGVLLSIRCVVQVCCGDEETRDMTVQQGMKSYTILTDV